MPYPSPADYDGMTPAFLLLSLLLAPFGIVLFFAYMLCLGVVL